MKLSIIIPTYNEADKIGDLITYLKACIVGNPDVDIIVTDGGSTDDTLKIIHSNDVKAILSPKKGRASQMNFGASKSKGDVLYFLHADSFPPKDFINEIKKCVENNYSSGCFRLTFDYSHWFLKLNCWFTKLDIDLIRFGDQSLFVKKDIFTKAGKYDERLIVMEDCEIISRIKRLSKFRVINKNVTTSARKYLDNGIYKLQSIFFLIVILYKLGFSQEVLVKVYKYFINQNKI